MARRAVLPPLLLALVVAASGWLYTVRGTGLPGPRVAEALPLDQLAKHDAAGLLWFLVVWGAVGCLTGLAARWARVDRVVAAGVLAVSSWGLVYLVSAVSVAITQQVPLQEALRHGARLEAVYLPAVVVGVAVALIAPPRPARRRAPALVAALVVLLAGVDLLHSVLPEDAGHALRGVLPDGVRPLAHAAGAFAALALLLASRGLARRRRRAWQLAVGVTTLMVVLDVLDGRHYRMVLASALLIVLLAVRHGFDLPGDRETRHVVLLRLAVAASVILGFGLLALWLNRLAGDAPFGVAFAARELAGALLGLHLGGSPHLAGPFGRWFPIALFALGLSGTAWVAAGWLAPWQHRVRQAAREREQVTGLVRRWGTDTLAPFALRRDKAYFLSEQGDAVISYRVVSGVAIVSGDPIGRPDALEPLLTRFLEHCRRCDWRVAVLGASEGMLGLYRAHGLSALYHGDEAVVETATFSLEGRAIRKVRQSVSRVHGAGYEARMLAPSELGPELRRSLEEIASSWRAGDPERGFAMALDDLFSLEDGDALYLVGFDGDGVPMGFLHFAVARAGQALSLSSMPRLRDATPNGFNEWLICEAIAWAREHGFRRVSLNFAPFAAILGAEGELPLGRELQKRALLAVKGHFQLDNLLVFNRKFDPRWERRFVVYERRLDLPRVGLAALAAEAYLPFQGARRQNRTAVDRVRG